MITRKHVASASAAMIAASAAIAGGETLARHEGAADPTTEGFAFNNGGQMMGAVGPLFGDGAQMLDAWFTDDQGTNSNLSYTVELTEEQTDAMLKDGFRLAAVMRSPTPSDDTDFGMTVQVENGGAQFLLRFGSDANGLTLVIAHGHSTIYVVPGNPNDYHLYELVDDDGDGDVDFYVDGLLRLADFAGVPATRRLVAFGDTSTTPGSGGRAHWASVLLETLGPPCVGDVNGDGFIGFADLNAIVSVFNTVCPGGCDQDVNGDELVNFVDLNIVVSAFNTACP